MIIFIELSKIVVLNFQVIKKDWIIDRKYMLIDFVKLEDYFKKANIRF